MSSEATDKKLTTKQKLIIAGIILVIITVIALLLYYNGKAAGKRTGAIHISTTPTDPSGSTASSSETEIKTIASDLYQDMKGANLLGHEIEPWNRWVALSDTDFVRVGNSFNEQYEKLSGETIRSWVSHEIAAAMVDGDWAAVRKLAVTRMAKLNMQ